MFFQNVLISANQVAILYVLVAIGFVCDKTGLYKEKTARQTNDLLFYVITPAVIIQSFMATQGTSENMKKFAIAFFVGVVLQTVAVVIALPFFNKSKNKDNCIYKYGSIYGNVGYMTLPLAQAVFGDEGVFYCSAVVIAFNMFGFTHGIYVMSDEKSKFDYKKIILNPGTLSVIAGFPIMMFDVTLPELIGKPISYTASLMTPIAMIIFGTYLSNTSFKNFFAEKRIWGVAIIKLLILPLAMLGFMKLLSFEGVIVSAIILSASSPSANNTVMFAAKYDKDVGKASQLVAVVSFISIITMPIMIALGQQLV